MAHIAACLTHDHEVDIAIAVMVSTAAALALASAYRLWVHAARKFTAGLLTAAAGLAALVSYTSLGPWLERHTGLANLPIFSGYALFVISSYLLGAEGWKSAVAWAPTGETRKVRAWRAIAQTCTVVSILGMGYAYFFTDLSSKPIPDPGYLHSPWSIASALLQAAGLLPTHAATSWFAHKELRAARHRLVRWSLYCYAATGAALAVLMILIRFDIPLLRVGNERMYLVAATLQAISYGALALAGWVTARADPNDDEEDD